MIGPGLALKVLIAIKPVDFRKGMDGLAALVQAELGAEPFSGVVYLGGEGQKVGDYSI